jgi:hypothetical protein
MKNFYLSIFLILLCILFEEILNDGCSYKNNGSTKNTDDTNDDYLKDITGDAAKQKCFSLSDSDVQTGKCCYDSANNKCTTTNTGTGIQCPDEAVEIKNNCGITYIYQPVTSDICTEISLVQGYCCFIKTKAGNTACIRTKSLNKDKNSVTDQMTDYASKCKEADGSNGNAEIVSVICVGAYLKFYWLLFIIITFIIF